MSSIDFTESMSRYSDSSDRASNFKATASSYQATRYQTTNRRYNHNTTESITLNQRLAVLTQEWMDGTMYTSSLNDIIYHPSHLKIVRIGKAALPFIFSDLRKDPKPWFYALRKITRADPLTEEDAGDFDRMASAWLKWAQQNGY